MEEWKLRPARDLGLKPIDRLRSLGRESGLVSLALNATWRRTVRAYLATAHRFRVEGRENLPAPPFVLIANHASHLDALALSAALRGEAARRAHAMAAGELFFGSAARSALAAYAINALPVWRGRSRRTDLDTMRTRLAEDGLVYILFPKAPAAALAPWPPSSRASACSSRAPRSPSCPAGWRVPGPPGPPNPERRAPAAPSASPSARPCASPMRGTTAPVGKPSPPPPRLRSAASLPGGCNLAHPNHLQIDATAPMRRNVAGALGRP
jgi:hypothetical protein